MVNNQIKIETLSMMEQFLISAALRKYKETEQCKNWAIKNFGEEKWSQIYDRLSDSMQLRILNLWRFENKYDLNVLEVLKKELQSRGQTSIEDTW